VTQCSKARTLLLPISAATRIFRVLTYRTPCFSEPTCGKRISVTQDANLYGAFLSRTTLTADAVLRRTHLVGAQLDGADISHVSVYEAELTGANLEGADLDGSDLRKADLRGAFLSHADIRGTDLRGAHLEGADPQGARYDAQTQHSMTVDLRHLGAREVP
jgi:uncharacterized protein YjbI with pentapeptide repeats